jgi:hypothetical protein
MITERLLLSMTSCILLVDTVDIEGHEIFNAAGNAVIG